MAFLILLLTFVIVPVAELSLLIRVGGSLGVFNTLALVIVTAVIGAYLVRQQGFATIEKVRSQTQAGQIPAMELAEGVALLFAGALLLTPGFITDALGFALLIPVVRQAIIRFFSRHLVKVQSHSYQSTYSRTPKQDSRSYGHNGSVIEGDFKEIDER